MKNVTKVYAVLAVLSGLICIPLATYALFIGEYKAGLIVLAAGVFGISIPFLLKLQKKKGW